MSKLNYTPRFSPTNDPAVREIQNVLNELVRQMKIALSSIDEENFTKEINDVIEAADKRASAASVNAIANVDPNAYIDDDGVLYRVLK